MSGSQYQARVNYQLVVISSPVAMEHAGTGNESQAAFRGRPEEPLHRHSRIPVRCLPHHPKRQNLAPGIRDSDSIAWAQVSQEPEDRRTTIRIEMPEDDSVTPVSRPRALVVPGDIPPLVGCVYVRLQPKRKVFNGCPNPNLGNGERGRQAMWREAGLRRCRYRRKGECYRQHTERKSPNG
jgi:hypothetical protein